MRRSALALLLLAGSLNAQTVGGLASSACPLSGCPPPASGPGSGTVTTTGTLAAGQVALGSGATSITGDAGLTYSGTGTGFKLGIGTDVFLSRASAGTLLVEDGSGNPRDVQARTGTFGTSVVTPLLVSGPGKSGTNVAGTNNTIQAEPGTGSATGSSLIFQTPTATTSGTTAQTQTTRLTIGEAASVWATATDGHYPIALSGSTKGIRIETSSTETGILGVDATLAGSYEPIRLGGSTVEITTNGTTRAVLFDASQNAIFSAPVRLKGYTVATLPAGTVGDTAYVTDATAPTYLGALTGGGAVTTPVFYNGAAWVSH